MENPDAVGNSEAAAAREVNQLDAHCAYGDPTGAKAPVARCWSAANSSNRKSRERRTTDLDRSVEISLVVADFRDGSIASV
jgi:hypothetical protein